MTGKQLRKMRLQRGLSVQSAANLLGVSRRSWVRWEAASVPPSRQKHIAALWSAEVIRLKLMEK